MRVNKNIFFGCLLGCVVFLSGCVSAPYYATADQESLSVLCRKANLSLVYDDITRSVQVTKNSKRIYALVGSDVVSAGTEKISLSTSVKFWNGAVYVPEDFRAKALCHLDKQFCVGKRVKRRSGFRVVIDPGHGGKDSGALGAYGLKEKDIVLDIARRLEVMLDRKGYDVKMTRRSDKFLSLEKRTNEASRWHADLFVSIHANASESSRAAGFEVWAPRRLDEHDFSEDVRKKNHQLLFQHWNMQERNRHLEKTLEDMLYQYKHVKSLKLASTISKGSSGKILSKNRGVKQSGFFVLRNTLVPSVLVEVGFISNRKEARQLKKSSYRQKIAEMLAESVQKYIRGL